MKLVGSSVRSQGEGRGVQRRGSGPRSRSRSRPRRKLNPVLERDERCLNALIFTPLEEDMSGDFVEFGNPALFRALELTAWCPRQLPSSRWRQVVPENVKFNRISGDSCV